MTSFRRILLKLSGESLLGSQGFGIDAGRLEEYAEEIAGVRRQGLQVGIVVGGGNIFRGLGGTRQGIDRVWGDQMGMLATVINSLALQSALTAEGVGARLFTSIRMEPVGELYSRDRAVRILEEGSAAILAGGTGNPFFTTDTAAALRAVEIGADAMLKGTRVEGVYSADPEKDPGALLYDTLTFDEIYSKGLKVMDLTAATLCRENHLPVIVFNMDVRGNLRKLVTGIKTGTTVTP